VDALLGFERSLVGEPSMIAEELQSTGVGNVRSFV